MLRDLDNRDWQVLDAGVTNGPMQDLRNIVDVLIGILKHHDPLNGMQHTRSSILSRLWKCLSFQRFTPSMRPLPAGVSPSTVARYPWLRWAFDGILALNWYQRSFLADILSNHLLLVLGVKDPQRIRATDPQCTMTATVIPEEPLLAAFFLASELYFCCPQIGSSKLRLQQALALAAVRLQISNLPASDEGSTATDTIRPCCDHGSAWFVEWADADLQEWANSKLM
jgi:hypothetical protein